MATLERDRAVYDSDARDLPTPTTFDPAAVPLEPSLLSQFAQPRLALAESQEDDDLINLGREQLFSGERQRRGAGQERDLRERDEAEVLPTLASQSLTEGAQATTDDQTGLSGSLESASQAFVLALSTIIRDKLLKSDHVVAGTTSAPSLSNVLLLLDAAETANPSTARLVDVRSVERASPLGGPPRPKSQQMVTLDEIAARMDKISDAEMLSAADAVLARSLVSLLSCLQRLQELCSRSEPSTSARELDSSSRSERSPERTLGETLERGTSALRSTGRHSPGMTRALREVERAERDLLWGRIDDLADQVRVLSSGDAHPVDELSARQSSSAQVVDETISTRTSIDLASLSDIPPEYSNHHHSRQDFPHSPPAYAADALRRLSTSHDADEKRRPLDPDLLAPRARAVSSAHSEKMRRDLDGVTEAIERLYVVSPQLANQRVEPDRRAQRERQLANLGNAIERLNQGRFEDQRASPSTFQKSDSGAQRATSPARRQLRPAVGSDVAFERLLDQIDKAARRTLVDQRVNLNEKRQATLDDATVRAKLDALFDESEAARRDFILRHTGKGRLNGQDAQLRSAPLQTSFDAYHFGGTSASADQTPLAASVAPAHPSTVPVAAASAEGRESVGAWRALKHGFLKRAPGSRRGSQDASSWAATTTEHAPPPSRPRTPRTVLPIAEVDWVVEQSGNLGSMVVSFWPRPGLPAGPYTVAAVERDALLVARGDDRPVSCIKLPCEVPSQPAEVVPSGNAFEVRLVLEQGSPTIQRADLELRAPLTTEELRRARPDRFHCSMCDLLVADTTQLSRFNALPSEHWAELLDAWMCHQDQKLSDDLIAKGNGILPRTDEGLVANAYVLLPAHTARNARVETGAQAARAENGDRLLRLLCPGCTALVGWQVVLQTGCEPDERPIRLLKYATYAVADEGKLAPIRRSLAAHLTAEMLETGQAHACHRFILEDTEDEQARLLLWFFNPSIRITFASSDSSTDCLRSSVICPTVHAVKVFYASVSGNDDSACASFQQAKFERMTYPRQVIERLAKTLESSTRVYPESKRRFGGLDVGFLERL